MQSISHKIASQGIHITGIEGEHRVRLKAVKAIADLSGPQDLVFLATKGTDCLAAARELVPFLKSESMVVSLQNGICDRGKELGMPTPVNNAVRAMVLQIEASQRKMSPDNVNELLKAIQTGKYHS